MMRVAHNSLNNSGIVFNIPVAIIDIQTSIIGIMVRVSLNTCNIWVLVNHWTRAIKCSVVFKRHMSINCAIKGVVSLERRIRPLFVLINYITSSTWISSKYSWLSITVAIVESVKNYWTVMPGVSKWDVVLDVQVLPTWASATGGSLDSHWVWENVGSFSHLRPSCVPQ